ncbi:unnamed protein product [Paramecium octaurelia]|uniref:Uncharacterized protein n=1 Tax=Paramecium octaurelia TaxID=43137 RepID=A0A8S1YKC4_PAROT|nr:unnamed protein product [Paramecium octaurelia]
MDLIDEAQLSFSNNLMTQDGCSDFISLLPKIMKLQQQFNKYKLQHQILLNFIFRNNLFTITSRKQEIDKIKLKQCIHICPTIQKKSISTHIMLDQFSNLNSISLDLKLYINFIINEFFQQIAILLNTFVNDLFIINNIPLTSHQFQRHHQKLQISVLKKTKQKTKIRIRNESQKLVTIQKQNQKQHRLLYYANELKQHHLLFQIINLNYPLYIKDFLKLIVDNLLSFKLNVRTTDKLQIIIQFSRENIISNKTRTGHCLTFCYLIKMELFLLFEYIFNLKSLLFNLQQKDLVGMIRTKLDCILNNLYVNKEQNLSIFLISKYWDLIQRYPIFCEQQSFGIIAESSKQVIQTIILILLINFGRLRIDPNYERDVKFSYFWNKDSREQLIQGLTEIMKERELSIVLAQNCVYCDLKTLQSQELYCKFLVRIPFIVSHQCRQRINLFKRSLIQIRIIFLYIINLTIRMLENNNNAFMSCSVFKRVVF